MQKIHFNKDNCSVYIGRYCAKGCVADVTQEEWKINKYTIVDGVIVKEVADNVSWDDRLTATYIEDYAEIKDVPSSVIDFLMECGEVTYDYEKLILCHETEGKVLMESRVDMEDPTQERNTRYTILATGLEYAGDVSELTDCGIEKYDIQTKQYCDEGENVFGTLVFNLISGAPVLEGITFHKTDGTAHTPVSPVEGACGAGGILYNTQEIFDVTGAQTFNAGQYHSLSFVIIEGTADVTVDAVTVTNLPKTFSNKYEADTVLSNDITITPAIDSRVIVTTIS